MIDIAEMNRQIEIIRNKIEKLSINNHECKCTSAINQENNQLPKKPVAKFKKVSREIFNDNNHYDNIQIPKRSTKGSAGYDFITPVDIRLAPGENVVIKTGIRCEMDPNLVLLIVPRSGQGFKYKIQLYNTVGVIDSDYYNSDNEGHIMIKLVNDNNENKTFMAKAGNAIAQGIFVEYFKTEDDYVENVRNGGFGSTTDNKTSNEPVEETEDDTDHEFVYGGLPEV